MTSLPAKLSVLAGKEFACVKIAGRANFNSSIDFKALLNELRGKGYNYFILELSECVLMDSTFLGVLAGFGLQMGKEEPKADNRQIELHNPNSRIYDLLESLGVLHLFKVSHGTIDLGSASETCPDCTKTATKEEITRACLEAHQTLMNINPDNIPKFKEVARFLAEDLNRQKTE